MLDLKSELSQSEESFKEIPKKINTLEPFNKNKIEEKIFNSYSNFSKETINKSSIFESYINKIEEKIKINFNPNFLQPINFPQNKGLILNVREDKEITPENLAELAWPIVQYIQQLQPDYIISCDRGGRMIGLAVHLLFQQIYGALPTKDHSIRFRRISKSVPEDETAAYLKADIEELAREIPNPKVLVLDDWVVSGDTRNLAERILQKFTNGGAQVFFGVMRGKGADVSGDRSSSALPAWKDDPSVIGVDYDKVKPRRVRTDAALDYRQRISEGVMRFAHDLYKNPQLINH